MLRKLDSASETVDELERWLETSRDCGRRYELEITINGSPIDDVLREWKEKIAAVKKEKGIEDAEEGAENTKGSGED
ncbi:hypothetical protein NLI96_g11515 [Meripilus lineatus]|uniref:Uncharacterized protein n=1 Tax=Meripilus lineatus TaxID=2056292 RepID=A0AAD5Y927_9APHY|nr:hypothetical protein NLI96_g11515 [Physisporinus lineatus]